jgi:hypothetical protein
VLIKIGCGGVSLGKLDPSMQPVMRTVALVWGSEEPVITSTWEGTHSSSSWHYFCRALDFRLPKNVDGMIDVLKNRLGKDYDVVLESTHIHIEYDPKGE